MRRDETADEKLSQCLRPVQAGRQDAHYPIGRGVIGRALIVPLLLLFFIGTAHAQTGNAIGQKTQPQQSGPKQSRQATRPKTSSQPPGLSEEEIREARELLSALGYWVNLDMVGQDASLRHALFAFQKVEDRRRTGILTTEELEALRQARRPLARESGEAHIEVDLFRQVLFVVDDEGKVARTLSVSTGSGESFTEGGRTRRAITPAGRFTITRKIEGWRKSPLGLIYYPNYFRGGVAIHGNPSVPPRPASHGCVRIPMFAAKEFSELVPVGTVVIVGDSSPTPSLAATSIP
jgi:lipoprotein-anchoring transpeptidase ErfK/SrfK